MIWYIDIRILIQTKNVKYQISLINNIWEQTPTAKLPYFDFQRFAIVGGIFFVLGIPVPLEMDLGLIYKK